MASTKLYLDTRNKRIDIHPLVVSVSVNNKTILIPTGVRLLDEHWRNGQVVIRPDKSRLNAFLRSFRTMVDDALIELSYGGRIRSMQPKDIKKEITLRLHPELVSNDKSFAIVAERFLSLKKGRTKEIYANTIAKMRRFCAYDSITFADITTAWLEDWESFFANDRTNTIAIDIRNIRAIFNYARKNGITKDYPFLNYRIKREKTRHRNNPPELICVLRNWDCEPREEKYRDIFILIYYLLGINIGDLCLAKRSDVHDGRLEYKRKKTGKLYSIYIHARAWEIINKYSGETYLLDIMEHYKDYRNFAKLLNKNIRKIGTIERGDGRGGRKIRKPIVPEDTSYWMRHSLATTWHKIGIPKDTISMALGHSFGADVTDTYIDYDIELVDKANDKALQYLDELEQTQGYRDLLDKLHNI